MCLLPAGYYSPYILYGLFERSAAAYLQRNIYEPDYHFLTCLQNRILLEIFQ